MDFLQKLHIKQTQPVPKSPYLELFKRKKKLKITAQPSNSSVLEKQYTITDFPFTNPMPSQARFNGTSPIIMNNTSFYQYYYIQPSPQENTYIKHKRNESYDQENNCYVQDNILPVITQKRHIKKIVQNKARRSKSNRPSVPNNMIPNMWSNNDEIPENAYERQEIYPYNMHYKNKKSASTQDSPNMKLQYILSNTKKPNDSFNCEEEQTNDAKINENYEKKNALILDSIVNLPKPDENNGKEYTENLFKKQPKLIIGDLLKPILMGTKNREEKLETNSSNSEIQTPSFLNTSQNDNKFEIKENENIEQNAEKCKKGNSLNNENIRQTMEFDEELPKFEISSNLNEEKVSEEIKSQFINSQQNKPANKYYAPIVKVQGLEEMRQEIIKRDLALRDIYSSKSKHRKINEMRHERAKSSMRPKRRVIL